MSLSKGNILRLLWMLLSTQTYEQQSLLERKVSIRFKDDPVHVALDKLKKELDCELYYSPSDLNLDKKITATYKQIEVGTIIRELWGNDQLILRAGGNDISVRLKSKKEVNNQKGNLSGRITDAKINLYRELLYNWPERRLGM